MNGPIPHDIPLPLPAAEALMKTLLVLSFLAHILFVNLMVGGVWIGFYYQLRGLKNPMYDGLARAIADTVTVNKSMAVVLGVAPLLLINTLYTVYFYSANALTGHAWIMIVPVVTVAFLLTYLHKYTWDLLASHRLLHLGIAALAAVCFALIPFIFLANVNLMLFPERWSDVRGFLSALWLPNVLPRYFHFVAASLAITGLFLVGYFRRYQPEQMAQQLGLSREEVLRQGYLVAFSVTALQFVLGPLLLFTLPSRGFSLYMLLSIFIGVLLALPALGLMWKELKATDEDLGKRWGWVVTCFSLVVLCMGTGRHLYRDQALAHHQTLMAEKTAVYQEKVSQAKAEAEERLKAQASLSLPALGEQVFQQSCSGCHSQDVQVVGPPVKEMVTIYANNPEALKQWIRAPGKKRAQLPQMPAFGHLPERELDGLVHFILKLED